MNSLVRNRAIAILGALRRADASRYAGSMRPLVDADIAAAIRQITSTR